MREHSKPNEAIHLPGSFEVVVDSREQAPWSIPLGVNWRVAKLDAGDYSLVEHEHRFAIERKSLNDFVSTVTTGHDRFRRELEVLGTYAFAAVVVEGTVADVRASRYYSKLEPATLLRIAHKIAIKYRVPVYFIGAPTHACAFGIGLLRAAFEVHNNQSGGLL